MFALQHDEQTSSDYGMHKELYASGLIIMMAQCQFAEARLML